MATLPGMSRTDEEILAAWQEEAGGWYDRRMADRRQEPESPLARAVRETLSDRRNGHQRRLAGLCKPAPRFLSRRKDKDRR